MLALGLCLLAWGAEGQGNGRGKVCSYDNCCIVLMIIIICVSIYSICVEGNE